MENKTRIRIRKKQMIFLVHIMMVEGLATLTLSGRIKAKEAYLTSLCGEMAGGLGESLLSAINSRKWWRVMIPNILKGHGTKKKNTFRNAISFIFQS